MGVKEGLTLSRCYGKNVQERGSTREGRFNSGHAKVSQLDLITNMITCVKTLIINNVTILITASITQWNILVRFMLFC